MDTDTPYCSGAMYAGDPIGCVHASGLDTGEVHFGGYPIVGSSMSHQFQRTPISKAIRTSGEGHGIVAQSDSIVVWAHRRRVGDPGRRSYHVYFTATRVLSHDVPRKTEEIRLPDSCRSNLDKVLAFLEKL